MRHPNQVFSQEAILNRVWSSASETSPDMVRYHVAYLRKKLDVEGEPSVIKTLHGQGYMMES